MRSVGIAAIFALIGPANAWALSDYHCTIERSISASDVSLGHLYIGKQFTVERNTGLMAGALKNSYFTDPQVIDYGDSGNSYKVVTTMRKDQGAGAGSSIFALTIMEFKDGARKPFIYLSDADAYLGWCEHF
jgi:hypothetical protein